MKNKSESLNQLKRACLILAELEKIQVREFCLCPGGRNAPFVYLLSLPFFSKPPYQIFHCFDERSAAFFALGRSKRTHAPTALVTTSGSAVAELFPAVMEAFYSKQPLVLLTADRPHSYRGSGAPQAVKQNGLFSDYVSKSFDLEKNSSFWLNEELPPKEPIHINVSFHEPLGDFTEEEVQKIFQAHFLIQKSSSIKPFQKKTNPTSKTNLTDLLPKKKSHTFKPKLPSTSSPSSFSSSSSFSMKNSWQQFFLQYKSPLILLGHIPKPFRIPIKNFLQSQNGPIYAEPLSGLREDRTLSSKTLFSGEEILKTKELKASTDCVLRIGGVPVLHYWRNLEKNILPVLNISHLPFKALSHLKFDPLSLKDFCSALQSEKDFVFFKESIESKERPLKILLKKDRGKQKKIKSLLENFPLSEPELLHQISLIVPENSLLFLGNSSPIRDWDWVATRNKTFEYEAQRGVNGIDGLISHFLGAVKKGKENWCLLGDLSALYDLNSLWMLKENFSKEPLRFVVVNNYGGKIFSRVFKNSHIFENSHAFEFSHWAHMFGCQYIKIDSKTSLQKMKTRKLPPCPLVIEIQPDLKETKNVSNFLKNYF